MAGKNEKSPSSWQPPSGGEPPEQSMEAGLARLRAAWGTMTARVEPGAEPPEAPVEVKALAQSTVMGGFLGMAYGGMREHRLNAARGLPSPPPGLPSKAHEAKWLAEANTARLLGTLRAAARVGILMSGLVVFTGGIDLASSIYHGERSWRDLTAAGLITGAAAGAFVPRSLTQASRVQSISAAIVGGTLVGLTMGKLRDQLLEWFPEAEKEGSLTSPQHSVSSFVREGKAVPSTQPYPERSVDSTAALVAQLEAGLSKRKAERQLQDPEIKNA
mmetsp:Transcript_3398/g.9820  ORF Transcript_3398/g.9820 Transcript_3398/m.9820 type:complete len:274 (+) Transcript_3398:201-1022(+)|eukprot:CAMPEP_0206134724 /NCGR_PEP_ID=MMETSP1473-20131121/174_1 /ASSEMBLY_ACC=CAM_ASM_001109 /TAXON_ID=1461547 /ORGANISM="Stichococcus sp, Strain RCC1054" /LENGTH=273 /DNA_ID=CAMNT_0053526345 /DNA_START=120 /DNA_END=941 /DNA_ORIENTATION=-